MSRTGARGEIERRGYPRVQFTRAAAKNSRPTEDSATSCLTSQEAPLLRVTTCAHGAVTWVSENLRHSWGLAYANTGVEAVLHGLETCANDTGYVEAPLDIG